MMAGLHQYKRKENEAMEKKKVTKAEKKDVEKLVSIFNALPEKNKERLIYVGEGILIASGAAYGN